MLRAPRRREPARFLYVFALVPGIAPLVQVSSASVRTRDVSRCESALDCTSSDRSSRDRRAGAGYHLGALSSSHDRGLRATRLGMAVSPGGAWSRRRRARSATATGLRRYALPLSRSCSRRTHAPTRSPLRAGDRPRRSLARAPRPLAIRLTSPAPLVLAHHRPSWTLQRGTWGVFIGGPRSSPHLNTRRSARPRAADGAAAGRRRRGHREPRHGSS